MATRYNKIQQCYRKQDQYTKIYFISEDDWKIKIILFTIAEKYGIPRNKSDKGMKAQKTLLREIIYKWRYTWLMSSRLNMAKIPVLPKQICKLNAISNSHQPFFVEMGQLALKVT